MVTVNGKIFAEKNIHQFCHSKNDSLFYYEPVKKKKKNIDIFHSKLRDDGKYSAKEHSLSRLQLAYHDAGRPPDHCPSAWILVHCGVGPPVPAGGPGTDLPYHVEQPEHSQSPKVYTGICHG